MAGDHRSRQSGWYLVHLDYQQGDVPAAPLDGLLDQRFDVIKVDAEGSDHIAMRGASQLLSRCPLAVVEFWPRTTMLGSVEPRQILDSYRRLGRKFGIVSETGAVEPVTVEDPSDARRIT